MKKKFKEFMKSLPDRAWVRYKHNVKSSNWSEEEEYEYFVGSSFDWDKTEEGSYYWQLVWELWKKEMVT